MQLLELGQTLNSRIAEDRLYCFPITEIEQDDVAKFPQ